MDLSRRARAAVLYATLSGALVIAMAGAAALFVEAPPVHPRHAAALLVPTTPRVAPSIAPVATATFPSATVTVPTARPTPRPTSGPTPPVPATPLCAAPSCPERGALAAASLPPVDLPPVDLPAVDLPPVDLPSADLSAPLDPAADVLDALVGGPLGDLAGSGPAEVPAP